MQFLTKDSNERLGCTASGDQSILDHAFFREIDWVKLEARQIEPPFKPIIVRKTIQLTVSCVIINYSPFCLVFFYYHYYSSTPTLFLMCYKLNSLKLDLFNLKIKFWLPLPSILHYWFSSQQSRMDVQNFDTFYTSEDPVLSLLHEENTLNLETNFKSFSFTNPDFVSNALT